MSAMKKIMLFAAVAALLAVSCTKDEPRPAAKDQPGTEVVPDETPGDTPGDTPGTDIPTDPVVLGRLTVGAADTNEPETRTTVDWPHVLWTSGDAICMFTANDGDKNAIASYTYSGATSASAEFVRVADPAPVAEDGYYYALYPTSQFVQWGSLGKKTGYVDIPSAQVAVLNSWDQTAGILAARSATESFLMKHVTAYVKFTIGPSSPAIKKLSVYTANGGNTVRRGSVYFGDDNMSFGEFASAAGQSIVVSLSSSDGNALAAGDYYIALIPKRYPSGLVFTFTNPSDEVAIKSVEKDITLSGGDVVNIGTIGSLTFGNVPTALYAASLMGTAYGTQGVYFWYDSANPFHGKIISATAEYGQWGSRTEETGATSVTGPDADNAEWRLKKIKSAAGYDGTVAKYAAAYCENMRKTLGGNWHLPTSTEFKWLFNSYFGKDFENALVSGGSGTSYVDNVDAMAVAAVFEASLATIPGSTGLYEAEGGEMHRDPTPSKGIRYWLDQEKSITDACCGRIGTYQNASGKKDNSANDKYIRCVKDVVIKNP